MFEISSSWEHTTPASFFNSSIWFLLYLWEARLWKNFVFWSPACSHKASDLCFYIFYSLINNPFISHFNWLTASIDPPLIPISSTHLSCSFFSFKVWVMFPKETQLHWLSFAWHSCIFPSTGSIGLPRKFHLQAKSTTSLQLASSNHICSNLQGFWHFFWIPFGKMIIGLWFEDPHSRCKTLVVGKSLIQFVVATAWSRLSHIVLSPHSPLHQV